MLLPSGAVAHPAFDPLRPLLAGLGERPGLEELNALAADRGQRIRFCPPVAASAKAYERRVFESGEVDTRADNLHDLFNALAWMAFPRTKAALNARHVASAESEGATRGPLRDLLTLVDEGGVIVACAPEILTELESLVHGFRWQELYWERRGELLADARFVLVGHSAYEKSLAPYPGITCKALFLPVTRQALDGPVNNLVLGLDGTAADWVLALPADAKPRQMAPLPVFGYPGWLPDSANPGFYADRRWFRPAPADRRTAAKVERAA